MAVPILTENSILVYDFVHSRSKNPFETIQLHHNTCTRSFIADAGEIIQEDEPKTLSCPVNKDHSMHQRLLLLEALMFGYYFNMIFDKLGKVWLNVPMKKNYSAPVVTIDGPSGCGKGTIAQRLAIHLHWHWLDSGALYRILAWAVLHYQVSPSHDEELAALVNGLKITFVADSEGSEAQMNCDGHEISQAIRTEACAKMASEISVKPFVRQALLQRQRDLRQLPGLVADGRDMGTVVFPDAQMKIFLTASPEIRAQRRYNQLINLGIVADRDQIQHDLVIRDQRDRERAIAPLKPAEDAIIIDTDDLGISHVFNLVLEHLNFITTSKS